MILPGRFLPVAEQARWSDALGDRVLQAACAHPADAPSRSARVACSDEPRTPPTAQARGVRAHRHGDARSAGRSVAAGAGDQREPLPAGAQRHRAGVAGFARDGRAGVDRRFRHRLLVDWLSQAPADRPGQDRQVLRARRRNQCGRRRRGARHRHACSQFASGGDRGRRRDRSAAQAGPRAGGDSAQGFDFSYPLAPDVLNPFLLEHAGERGASTLLQH